MHELLQRQLEQHLKQVTNLPESLREFVSAVDRVYHEVDAERKLMREMLKSSKRDFEERINKRNAKLADAESKYRYLVERLPAVVYICEPGADGRCTYTSPQLETILGFSPEDWTQNRAFWFSRIHPEDRQRALDDEKQSLHHGLLQTEYRMIHRDGRTVFIRDEAMVVNGPEGTWLHGVLYDVTDQHKAQEALRESEERFRTMADTAPVLVWGAHTDGGFTFFNKRWSEFTGRRANEESGRGWMDSVHPDDRRHIWENYHYNFSERQEFRTEFRMLRADGEYRWMMNTGVPRFSPDGTFAGYIGTCIDITDRKKAEEQLLHDAFHDELTGLPNRALFTDRLERALTRQKRNKSYSFAVLFMDLDRFKVINDSLGHYIGDQLLMAFARRLQACLRPGDTVARLGGDEFTVLLDDIGNPDEAVAISERIHEQLKAPFGLDHEVFTTASIGIAINTGKYLKAEELLRDADTAMYRAKAQGPGRNQLFDAEMHASALQLLLLENDLRRAVDRGEFFVNYQPIVALKTGRVMRFEALVRWRHPERGIVSPAEFIPIAEETGLIVPIGRIVLEQSICQLQQWRKACPHLPWLGVNVNLSGKQFTQPDLVQQVQAMLARYELDPRHLGLEITESALMVNPDSAKTMLHKLRELGVSVYLDDFGTGYSSLGYLQQFSVDGLKIDRSFLSPSSAERNGQIVHTIITMAHDLGLPVTAEGIETAQQSQRLADLNCEFAQGYFFAKPLDPLAAEKLLVNTPILNVAPATAQSLPA